jgi:tetratricopeptide (TPR) repeat protein
LHDQAIAEANKALQLDPNYGMAVNLLAYTYAAMDDFEQAIEYVKWYSSLCPGDANPFDSMAEIYFQMRRFNEAIAKFQEALARNPDFINTIWKIGYIYALMEIYPEALKWNDRSIDVPRASSEIASGYVWEGIYHYWLGRFKLSFVELNKAMDLRKATGFELEAARVDWCKALIYLDMGEFNFGKRYFKNWFDYNVEYNPQHKSFYTAEHNFYHGLINLKEGSIDSVKVRLNILKSLLPEVNASQENHTLYFYHSLYSEVMLAEDSLEKAMTLFR